MEEYKKPIDASTEDKEPADRKDIFGINDGCDDIKALEFELLSFAEEHEMILKRLHKLEAEAYKSVYERYISAKKIGNEDVALYLSDKDIRKIEADELLMKNEEYLSALRDHEDLKVTIKAGEIQLGYITRRFQATLPVMQHRIKTKTEQLMAECLGGLPAHGNELIDIAEDKNNGVEIKAATGTLEEMIEILQKEKIKRDKKGRAAGTAAGDVQYT